MNYRHIYHAGNFADVVKHTVLALVIESLKQKDTPFRVIDTHAGTGRYDLNTDEAQRTGEWRGGIGRLIGADAETIPAEVADLLEPYLRAVYACNEAGTTRWVPGSPAVTRSLLRACDSLVVNELHPDDAKALRAMFRRDAQTKVLALDGWTALKALLPPKERRGVILIDPPFEVAGEWQRLAQGLDDAVARFATGVYLMWYPIKDLAPIAAFAGDLVVRGHTRLLQAEVMVRPATDANRLNGCGLMIVNPPYQLDVALKLLFAFLAARLAADGLGDWRLLNPAEAQHPQASRR